jgi:hypothetical protein
MASELQLNGRDAARKKKKPTITLSQVQQAEAWP